MNTVQTGLMLWLAASGAWGQQYVISTVAGGGLPVNIPGTSASIPYTSCPTVDPAGNVYFSTGQYSVVLRLDAVTGMLTVVAGTGGDGFSGDGGPATSAQLRNPCAAVDAAGNIYIADTGNNRIRKVSSGIITTIAGTGGRGFSGDGGPAASALLNSPTGVAVDPAGNVYIADTNNNRIRKVSNGIITTLAGNGSMGFSGDAGPATNAQFHFPSGVAVDAAGNVYTADQLNHRVRKVSNGIITTIAGDGTAGFGGDGGPAPSAQLNEPGAVAVDPAGNVYISDSHNDRIRKVSNGIMTTIAGNGMQGFGGDGGPGTSAQLGVPFRPYGVAADAAGNVYIADSYNNRIRKVSNGIITTIAGDGTFGFSGDGGPATGAQLSRFNGVAVDALGNVFIADSYNNRIRKVSNGIITTIAGTGTSGFSGDGGPAITAQLSGPYDVAVDAAGIVFIVENYGSRVRKVSNGVITTVAGNGTGGFSGDGGPAINAGLTAAGVAVDAAGNVYIADTNNFRIRKVSNGIITTIAGDGTAGFSGDGGPATSAQLNSPSDVAVDATGNVYIADYSNGRIRKISNGIITTIANAADFFGLSKLAADAGGNVYIADWHSNLIRKVSNGIITPIAGDGTAGFSGDGGPAITAQLSGPYDVAVDAAGNVYVADQLNFRVRALTPSSATCAYSLSPASLQPAASGGTFPITIQTAPGCSWGVTGLPSWITVSGTNSGTGPATVTLVVAANSGAARNATLVAAGVSVTVTQAGSCSYLLSPGGQAFVASGGTGSISITAGAACSWSANGAPIWVTLTSASSSSGNGTLTYQVAANSGAARSGTISIAGLSFIIDQASASLIGFNGGGSMAHIAAGGGWATTFTLVNASLTTSAQFRLNLFDDNGNPLALPLNFPQNASLAGPELASTLDKTLAPGAELIIVAAVPGAQTSVGGWAQLLTNGAVTGSATFRYTAGSLDNQALVPLETRNAPAYLIPFDNTNGFVAGIALANTSAAAGSVGITIRDDTGAVVFSTTLSVPGNGHTAFVLPNQYPVTANKAGTLEFDAPVGGQISTLGIQFNNATLGFSSVLPLVKQ